MNGDIDSLTEEQHEENDRIFDAIESMDDVYKTYRPKPRSYYQRSSSTSTLKGGENLDSVTGHSLQEAEAKTDITDVTDSNREEEEEGEASLTKKAAPPPTPPRPTRAPLLAPKEFQDNYINDAKRDTNNEMRIASGEMTGTHSKDSQDQPRSIPQTQFSYTPAPMQSPNAAQFLNGESGGQEMIASDYYAQQLAMQMSNPLYSYGGYGHSQFSTAAQGYQYQTPESEYFNYTQLQGQLQSMGNYGQYSSMPGIPLANFLQSGGANYGPHMAGGGGNPCECHMRTTDSGESSSFSTQSTPEQNESQESYMSASSMQSSYTSGQSSSSGYSRPSAETCCSKDEQAFEMPEGMHSMPQCRVGSSSSTMPTQSRFSFIDKSPSYNMCCDGLPPGCTMPHCMIPPQNCNPCGATPCYMPSPPPAQCYQVPCAPAPCYQVPSASAPCYQVPFAPAPTCAPPAFPCAAPPACCPVSCCSPTPNFCACSGNCLDIDAFIQKMHASQRPCCSSAPAATCYRDDRLQSQTVYAADYQPFSACGNNFNHFPHGSSCTPPLCSSPPFRAPPPPAGCCPYELPRCTLPPPFPATCHAPCYAPCSVPCLSPCTDYCFPSCSQAACSQCNSYS